MSEKYRYAVDWTSYCLLQALAAVKILLQLRTIEASVFKDFCALDKVLERMRLQLEQLMEVEDQRDYAKDVEILRLEVELIYYKKLEKVRLLVYPSLNMNPSDWNQ